MVDPVALLPVYNPVSPFFLRHARTCIRNGSFFHVVVVVVVVVIVVVVVVVVVVEIGNVGVSHHPKPSQHHPKTIQPRRKRMTS